MPKITQLTSQKKRNDRVNVHVDGAYWKAATLNSIADLQLHSGMEFTEEEFIELGHALDEGRAAQTAIDILSHRQRSRGELAQRLGKRADKRSGQPAFTEEAIERALDRLVEKGYINDGSYARLLCRDTRARGYGRRRAKDRMRTAVIDRDLADEALEAEYPPEAEAEVLTPLVAKENVSDRGQMRRFQAKLQRRGFDGGAIREALSDIELPEQGREERAKKAVDLDKLATQVKRRYPKAAGDSKERNKAFAFLLRRGLTFGQAQDILARSKR